MRPGGLAATAILVGCLACERPLVPDAVDGGQGGTTGLVGTGGDGGPGGSGGVGGSTGGTGGPVQPPPDCSTIVTSIDTLNPCGHTFGLAFSPDGRYVAMGTEAAHPNAHVWRMSDGARVLDIDGVGAATYNVAFSPDGRMLVTAGGYNEGSSSLTTDIVKLWDVPSGALVRTVSAGCGFYASGAAFSPDGTLLATSGFTGPIEIWRLSDGVRVTSIPYPTTVHNVHFSPDGSKLIAGGVDERATVWSVPAGTLLLALSGTADEMADAAFSPDGAHIATTGMGNVIKVWDATNGTLLQTLTGHTAPVSHVVWVGPDRLLTNDWSGTINSWTRGPYGFSMSDQWLTGGQSLGIALSPDGKTFGTGGMDQAGAEGFVFLPL